MGCGESKHAVATTESISTSKRLNSGNSKKVQNAELPNDFNVSTIEKTTNALPNGPNNPTIDKSKIETTSTNLSTTLPASINQEIPKNVVKKDKDVTKTTQENAIIADNKKDLSLVVNKENDEQLNKAKIVEPFVILKKENEGHDRELSLESHDDFLSVNDTKSEGQSPCKNVTESIVQEDEKSIDLVNTVNQSTTKEAEEYENIDDTKSEDQSLPCENIAESVVQEDEKPIDLVKTVNESTAKEPEEKDEIINDTEFYGQSPACENNVESAIQEDEKLIDLVNTVNESTPKEEEKDESSKIQVLSEMDEVKEASPSVEIDASNKVEKEENPLVKIGTIDKEEKNDIVSNMGARSDEISED